MSCRAPWGSAPEPGSQEGLRQGGTCVGPSRTFQDLVEAPKEYPPHFGQVEGGLLQGGAGVTAEVGQRLSAGWGAGQGARETPRRKAGGRAPEWSRDGRAKPQRPCCTSGPCLRGVTGAHRSPPTDRPAGPPGRAGSLRPPPATARRPRGASRGAGAGGRRLCVPWGGWPGGCRCGDTAGATAGLRGGRTPGTAEWCPWGQAEPLLPQLPHE